MKSIEKSEHEYKVAIMSGLTFLIYDGNGKSAQRSVEQTAPEKKSFTDRVMDDIENSFQFKVIDGELTDDMDESKRGPKARIEYVGPNRLPRITTISEQSRDPIKTILNFFKKK
jgi:hypothetical protein